VDRHVAIVKILAMRVACLQIAAAAGTAFFALAGSSIGKQLKLVFREAIRLRRATCLRADLHRRIAGLRTALHGWAALGLRAALVAVGAAAAEELGVEARGGQRRDGNKRQKGGEAGSHRTSPKISGRNRSLKISSNPFRPGE
jgi:hypothetical protein